MAVFDNELHASRLGDDLLHLTKVDKESTVATDNYWIGAQVFFHLLGCGTKHVGTHPTITQITYLHIVAYCLNKE